MTEDSEASVPTARGAPQHVRLFPVDDAYEHLCILTLLPSLGPLHLMLADALSPHGSNATLASVGTLSEGFERFVTSPLYLVGYVRWDARSDQSSFVKRSLQQLSGRNPPTRLRASVTSLLRALYVKLSYPWMRKLFWTRVAAASRAPLWLACRWGVGVGLSTA